LSAGRVPGSPYTEAIESVQETPSANAPPPPLLEPPDDEPLLEPPSVVPPPPGFELLEHAIHTTDDASTRLAEARTTVRIEPSNGRV
jgi:hypothetical protein